MQTGAGGAGISRVVGVLHRFYWCARNMAITHLRCIQYNNPCSKSIFIKRAHIVRKIVPQDVAARASSEHQRFEKQDFVSSEEGRGRKMISRTSAVAKSAGGGRLR